MVNQSTAESSVNIVQSLPFDVIAVPQNNISEILDAHTGTAPKPVNIKIKVRNKEEKLGEHGVISVPKLSTSGPKKVRLVSSDQTIISFNLFMGAENEEKVSKKSHYKFLQLFKPSGCFNNNQNDDDVYPYVPSSSNETYRARSASNVNNLQNDKIYEEQFALKKNLSPIINSSTTLGIPSFLGKCKPGGCLDPPFSEDKYIYKPKPKMLTFERKNIENHVLTDEKNIKDIANTDKVVNKPYNIIPNALSKNSIEEANSHSLITYPPTLSSSEIRSQEETQNKKSKIRPSFENNVRISTNEFSNTYFMPPKKHKNKINERLDTEFLKIQILKSDSYNSKIENSLMNQKEPTLLSPTPTNDHNNLSSEEKILINNVNDKSKNSRENCPLNDDNNEILIELSSSNIGKYVSKEKSSTLSNEKLTDVNLISNKIKINSSTNSLTGIMTRQETESQDRETKTDIISLETSRHSSSLILKDLSTSKDDFSINMVTNNKDYQSSKHKSNSNETQLNPIPRIPDVPLNNHSQAIQRQNTLELSVNHQTIRSFTLTTDENKIKSDRVKTDDKDAAVIDNLPDTENLQQVLIFENASLCQKNGQSIQSEHSQLPFAGMISKGQKDSQLNKPTQDVVMINEKNNNINNSFGKNDSYILEDKYNDGGIAIAMLNKADVAHPKSITLSSKDLKGLINEEPNLSEKSTNMTAADLRMDGNNTSDKIDSNKEPPIPTLKQKTSLILQIQESNASINTSDLRSGSNMISDNTDFNRRISTPTLQEKISLTLQTLEIDTNMIAADLRIDGNIKLQHKSSLTLQIQETDTKVNSSDFKSGSNIISRNTDPNGNTSTSTLQKIISSTSEIPELDINTLVADLKMSTNIIPGNDEFDKETQKSTLQDKSSFTLQKQETNKSEDTSDLKIASNIISDNTDSNGITSMPTMQEQLIFSSTLPTPQKDSSIIIASNTISDNIDSNKETPKPTLQEESFTLQIQEQYTINEETVYYSLNESDRVASRTDYLEIYNTDDAVLDLHNMNETVQIKGLDQHILSSKDIESVDKEILETKRQMQLHNIEFNSILSNGQKPFEYDSQKTINNKNLEDHTENLSKNDPALFQKSWKKNDLDESSRNLKESLINDNKSNLEKPGKDNILRNNSSLEINLGFYAFESDKNKTIIKTFDTSEDLQMDPQNKLTVIKSMIRKNYSEIIIPVNSEMDLTLQLKKTFKKDSTSKIDMNDTKTEKTDEATINKDILLQEILDTVYKNLVPVENIIRNLKEEADGLTNQQVLFRELLNTLKTKSVRMSNTSNKCSCSKYLM